MGVRVCEKDKQFAVCVRNGMSNQDSMILVKNLTFPFNSFAACLAHYLDSGIHASALICQKTK